VDRSHRRGVPHKTNLADSADSARNVNDPLTVRLVCTKIPYQSIYGIVCVCGVVACTSTGNIQLLSC
jgi:hypothetical protein